MSNKKIKHNYTSELELKSLLIRIKNSRNNIGKKDLNEKINKYIKTHTAVTNKTLIIPGNKTILKKNLKKRIIQLSEITSVDEDSYERFGEIILLMIKKILTKPQFSGYTYKDDFYSDAIYKILKYLGNFNHKLISKITGQPVNAFAYISQIIHNSILFILNSKKKEKEKLNKQVQMEHLNHNLQFVYTDWHLTPESEEDEQELQKENFDFLQNNTEDIILEKISESLLIELKKININQFKNKIINIFYPFNYKISFEEYNEIKPLLNGKINIIRMKNE